jgi:acetyl-CoA C-acetyltransferase
MTEVVIAGIGQTEVGEHWDIGLRDLAYAAIHDAIQDAGGLKPQSLFVGNMLAPNLSTRRTSAFCSRITRDCSASKP